MGEMANAMDQKRMVRGHGVKGRWDGVELQAFEDPIVLGNAGWQNLPQPWSYTLFSQYVR
jgi:hypothetical protein